VGILVDQSHEMAIGLCENFDVLSRLSEGDLTARAPEESSNELLGRLGEMINKLSSQLRILAEQAEEIAMGDLSSKVELTGDLPEAFNHMAEGLKSLVLKIQGSASRVAVSSAQVLSASEQQAAGVSEEASQVSETAASARELTATAKQVSDLSQEIAGSSASSVDMVHTGTEAVDAVVSGMSSIRDSVTGTARKIEALGEKSQSITEITSLIEDIADQTNLLSVNAAIEAARAGEAGKGFAVVADAIGQLAERTAKSTKEISELIKGIQQETSSCVMSMEETTRETERGSTLAEEAGSKLREIESAFDRVAESAKEISLASRQQMSGSEQISKAMAEIEEIMRQSASGAKQSAESAREMSELAEDLKRAIEQFRLRGEDVETEVEGSEEPVEELVASRRP
jgi:methyl-accepting chemotaxis protein